MTNHRPHIIGLLAAGMLLAGCGSASPTHTSGTANATQSSFGAKFVAFASCMRSHGVPSYPDPHISSSAGEVHVQISPGSANPNGPAFKSADAACHQLLPNGGTAGAGASAQEKAQGLKFADCMRSHGVPNFPDSSHDGAFDLPPGLNPQAPQFSQAEHACQGVEPSSLSINQSG